MTETNPYLALLQQERPRGNWLDILSNALLGAGSGLSQAGAAGQSGWAGIGPGLMLGNQMTAQAEHQAEQERMRRLQIGIQASEWDEKRKLREQQQTAMEQWRKTMGAPGMNVEPSQVQMGPGTPDQNAIGGIESAGQPNGGYGAVGPVANNKGQRAYGKYQIMDFNVGPWTQEVLGKPMTPQEFLANPQAQDAVFNAKFGQYSQKYGPVGASRAWFAGEGGMNNPNASDVNGMTVQRYGDRFAQSRGVAQAPVGPPPVGLGGAGPTLSALPAFEGPGMGTIQPGALAQGVLPSVNLLAPAPPQPPPQVAQGDNVTASGASVDPNAPMPAAVGGPNAVPVQYNPTPATPGMPTAPPRAPSGGPPLQPPTVPMPRPQDLPASYRQYLGSLPVTTPHEAMTATTQAMTHYQQQLQEQANKQWERQWSEYAHSRGLTEEQAKEQRKLETELVDVQVRGSNEVKSVTKAEALAGAKSGAFVPLKAGEVARAEAKQKLDVAQAKVNPDTLQPNQPLIQAETQQAAAITAAQESAKLDTTAASALVTQAVKEFSDKERPKGLAIQETIPNIHNVRRLVEAGAITGTGTETRNYLAQLASTLGFQSKEAALTPAYLGAMADQIVANAKSLGVNPTNRDNEIIQVAKGANPNVSKEGVLQLLDVQEQLQRRAHQRYTAEAKRIQSMRGVKQAYGEDYFNLPEPPKYDDWLKENPLPGQQGPSGTTFPVPPPAAIKNLQMNPARRDEYDALFGPGAAAKVLGR